MEAKCHKTVFTQFWELWHANGCRKGNGYSWGLIVPGNMFPDLDNLAVAYAKLTGADPHGLHRTFAHGIFTMLFFMIGAEGLSYTIFGAFSLLSLIIAIVVTIRMRKTIEILS